MACAVEKNGCEGGGGSSLLDLWSVMSISVGPASKAKKNQLNKKNITKQQRPMAQVKTHRV